MLKKILLVVASLAVIAIGFQIYRWQDESLPTARPREGLPLPPKAGPSTGPQPAWPGAGGIPFRDVVVGPGQSPVLHVYDKEGKTRAVFRSTRWNAISDNEFDLFEPAVRLTLPGGQVAYVRADEGRIVVQQGSNDNPNPKRGQLRGNVRLFVDLTDYGWREKHADRAEVEQHPEAVIKLWLDYVRFDLDLSLLDSDGPILLQSAQGDLEGKGLRLVWSDLDRRIQQLVISEGKHAVLRSTDPTGVSPSRDKAEKASELAPAANTAEAKPATPAAAAVEKREVKVVWPAERGDLPYIRVTGETQPLRPSRVDTYRLTFRDHVVVEQKEGGRIIGGLSTPDVVTVLFDVNPADRRETAPPSTEAPPSKRESPAADKKSQSAQARSVLELHWAGPLEIAPVQQEPAARPAAPPGNNIRVIAKGSPVEIRRQNAGRVICPEVEYRDETGQVWLRGSEQHPVTLEPNQRQQLVVRGTVAADQKNRRARIDGPGRLIDRGQDDLASAPLPVEAARSALADLEGAEFTWNRSVDIEFGMEEQTTTETRDLSPIPKGAYLKHAVFEGGATFTKERRSIAADHFDVVFGKPVAPSKSDDPTPKMVVERAVATGHVRMTVLGDGFVETVECDRLEVDLGLDDVGNNVPRTARAVGHVVANRIGRLAQWGPGSMREALLREIRADDELILDMTSVPKPVAPEEAARIEAKALAAARIQGIEPGSDQWRQREGQIRTRLAKRRQTSPTRVRAAGRVAVFDRRQELDLTADSIDCELGQGREEIRRALIIGRDDQPARVEMADFGIRGSRINVDAVTQSAEVPGPGTLRFMTKQDLDGRAVDKPIPVLVSWDRQMWLAGDRNTGRIVGSVHAVSENVTLDCRDEMQLQFENLAEAKATTRPAGPDLRRLVGVLADAVRPRTQEPRTGRTTRRIRKRLTSLDAVGEAVILASMREEVSTGGSGIVSRWLAPVQDTIVKWTPATAPSSHPAPVQTRLASRVRVAGPHVLIGLADRQMLVDGAGHLLIEDYRVRPERRQGRSRDADAVLLGGPPTAASLDSIGPSQTLFTWTESMSFLNSRNAATFHSGVEMRHLSGSGMFEIDRLAAAMGIDPEQVRKLPAREAGLVCDLFSVEFERDAKLKASDPSPLSRATRLKAFLASGRFVRLEESGRFVEGTEVSYDGESQIGRVTGSAECPAKLGERNQKTGQVATQYVERFVWDQRTGLIDARKARGVGVGK